MHEIRINPYKDDSRYSAMHEWRFNVSIYCSFTNSNKELGTIHGTKDAIIFALAKSKDLGIPFDQNKFLEDMKEIEKEQKEAKKKKDC